MWGGLFAGLSSQWNTARVDSVDPADVSTGICHHSQNISSQCWGSWLPGRGSSTLNLWVLCLYRTYTSVYIMSTSIFICSVRVRARDRIFTHGAWYDIFCSPGLSSCNFPKVWDVLVLVLYMTFQPETEGFDFVVSSVLSSASLEPDGYARFVGGYAAELL